MAASTVPAAKTAVLTMLRAIPALNTVSITWTEPTETEDLADEMIFFRGPTVRLPEWREIGGPNSPLWEQYTLLLVIKNRTFDDDPASAEQRTWELVALVETALRADLRLGGLLRLPIEWGEQEAETFPLSDGWYGETPVPLVCQARI